MTIDSTFLMYFINAGLVVKFVMLLLIAASIISWTYILQRTFYLKEIRSTANRFENSFWSGGDLSRLYDDSIRRKE